MWLYDCLLADPPVTLETVLAFFTGSEEIPPLGYGSYSMPSIRFDQNQSIPKASTCAIELTLSAKYYDQPAKFKTIMDTAMLCHGGFGLP